MKVLVHRYDRARIPKRLTYRLECNKCRCLFEAEYEEFDIELVGDHTEWYIDCPECGDRMHVNPTKLVFGQVEY